MLRLPIPTSLLLLLLQALAATALAMPVTPVEFTRLSELRSGSLLFSVDEPGLYLPAPTLKTTVDIKVTGPIARTRLVQEFHNPGSEWAEAIYAFPLPENAAVDRLRMLVGERIIVGEIQEKAQARATYARASANGQRAALVEQSRPNLFSTRVANIAPDARIRIELEYQQLLHWRDGAFSLRFPMAITPRYTPLRPDEEPASSGQPIQQQFDLVAGWAILPGELPNAVEWPLPGGSEAAPAPSLNPTTLHVQLQAGFALADVRSDTHAISSRQEPGQWQVELAGGAVRADRDFVLHWRPAASEQPQAAFFTEQTGAGNYGLLMLMPPQQAMRAAQAQARELIFVIDTSGSMGGQSIRAARAALLRGLDSLQPGDSFNLIEFDSNASALFSRPVLASESNISRARRVVKQLRAGGGTEMAKALRLALSQPARMDVRALRQLVFITDGAVGNEKQLYALIHAQLGQARLFTVGIGSAPNSHFMTEAAHFGRGSFSYIASADEVEAGMTALFEQLRHPALTDIQLQLAVQADVLPSPIPDLYLGEPLVLAMKLAQQPKAASVRGRIGTRPWSAELQLANPASQAGLGVLWARQKIRHWERSAQHGVGQAQRRERIVALALEHHLVSAHTSLVAVDKTPARDADSDLQQHALKGELPAGLEAGRPVRLAQGATPSEWLLGFGALLLLLGALLRTIPGRRVVARS